MKSVSILGLCIVLLGAAAPLRAESSKTDEAGIHAEATARLFKAVPGKAVIYLVRDRGDLWTWSVDVYLDGQNMGATGPLSYFRWEVDPGRHVLVSDTLPPALLEFTTEPGGLYYVWQDINTGQLRAPSELRMVDQTTARSVMATAVLLQNKE